MRKLITIVLAVTTLIAILWGIAHTRWKSSPLRAAESETPVNATPLPTALISEQTRELINEIRNADITWGFDLGGVLPSLHGATLLLRNSSYDDEDITPLLIDALLDEDRFVAAHVLLGLRLEDNLYATMEAAAQTGSALPGTPVTAQVHPNTEYWHGLTIEWTDEGISYQRNNLAELRRMWKERLNQ